MRCALRAKTTVDLARKFLPAYGVHVSMYSRDLVLYRYVLSVYRRSDDISALDENSQCLTSIAYRVPS